MDFKSPFFFIAFALLIIPIIIHLFNLRKYKKIYFPSTRFLDDLKVTNKKLSKIQRWALLISRCIAILFLVLAFAHPYFKKDDYWGQAGKKVLFIDNSLSTEYLVGQQTLLDIIKQKAIQWIQSEQVSEVYILTQDQINNVIQYSQEEAIDYISSLQASPYAHNFEQLNNSLQNIQDIDETSGRLNVLIISDLQENLFKTQDNYAIHDSISFYYWDIKPELKFENVYIDTCYFLQTALESEHSIELVTEIRTSHLNADKEIELHYALNGTSFHTKALKINAQDTLITDTAHLQLMNQIDNNIHVYFDSKELAFDDHYYINTRISQNLKVGIVNTHSINHPLTQAFNSSKKIFPEQFNNIDDISNPQAYALIFLNNINYISTEHREKIKNWVLNGASVAISIGREAQIDNLNSFLNELGQIKISKKDTTLQNVVDLEINHPLIKDVIAQKTDNLQLPFVQLRYVYTAPIHARPLDLMKMRDGFGWITQFNIGKGIVYLIGSPLDLNSTNLTQSYYFAPIMYKMATNTRQSDIQSYSINPRTTIRLNTILDENTIIHLKRASLDIIPIQQKEGHQLVLNLPENIHLDSIYNITDQNGEHLQDIAFNYDRQESQLDYIDKQVLKERYNIAEAHISTATSINTKTFDSSILWKIALIFVILALSIETYLLIKK